ncbi:helix-turn-helix transcriptional regulator (plasmid) [Methylobacterium sp. NMS14P]|uniref:winged helix-turn-helix transcriptional regulator n=1 Tax=Methylobacterium sp. NMS14P TaxID=2894310 RepID=UPI002359BEE2|nr:helix-turn-helix domain-containing protein [Methylobacterium sp. NMS14P]WCS28547.1 helix-turn-helix transcriptional regulator [Methylobacterium sp. NMS14P]
MAKTLYGRDYEETEQGPRLKPCAPHDVLSRMGDKWTILTLLLLSIVPGHRLRFSAIKNGIEGITQRMLTVTLRNMERDGLLVRHYFPEVPPRVEYELTPMGTSLLPALEGFTGWIREHWPLIVDARRSFDKAQGLEHQAAPKEML